MRYSKIREMDVSNGEGLGVSLFVQGCHFHCRGCFNPETWDFSGGKEWTNEIKNKFLAWALPRPLFFYRREYNGKRKIWR